MQNRWNLLKQEEEDKVKRLANDLGLSEIHEKLCQILLQRGIDTFEKAKAFFRPDKSQVHDPFLMQDMDRAVDRIIQAIQNEEQILIYGDYDVDGTTSVAMMYSFLSSYYPHLAYYIPDRYKEGYGISLTGIDYAADNNFSLIIALDCGIKAIEQIEYANNKDIDFIICDHHEPGETIPNAVAALDPKRSDCSYPFKFLSGCGVGYKLMQGLCKKSDFDEALLDEYLDFLAVSICADIVPIIGENRVLCSLGMQQLENNPHLGFKTMMAQSKFNTENGLSVKDIVFTLAPRINAAGRIGSGTGAVDLMVSQKKETAEEIGLLINQQNTDRRSFDSSITEEALALIEQDPKAKEKKTTVLYKEDWHKGVIGIVASRCIEKYYRPTIILTKSNGLASGSARSVKGYSVYNAIEQCSDLLSQFGGHKYAAGMTMPIENIPAFQEKFEAVVSETIDPQLLIPEIDIDTEITLNHVQKKFYQILKQFAPFGPENMQPVFLSRGLVDRGMARRIKDKHLKMHVIAANRKGPSFDAIAFGLGHYYEAIRSGTSFDLAYAIEENNWNGKKSLQLVVKDIRLNQH